MNIAKKLPDSLKRHVFEYNPDHRKFLKDVHIELLNVFILVIVGDVEP